MKNLFRLFLIVAFLGAGAIAEAQQPKTPRIGILVSGSVSSHKISIDALREGLSKLGYVEGKNILIEYRYAEGQRDRLPDLAAAMVRLRVDVIVGGGADTIVAAKNATNVIPIVMTTVSDPVALGLVASLARPGGNITGLTVLSPELGGKRLELLKEVVAKLSRVAVLVNRDVPGYGVQMKEMEVAAQALGLQLQPLDVRGPADLDRAFSAITSGRSRGLTGLQNPTFGILKKQIADLAVKRRLPTIYGEGDFVDGGGLMSYGTSVPELYRRAATYVDKILKGRTPDDLPVEQPMKFELVINLKTAKLIGLTIPQWTLMKADRVIK